VTSLLRCLAFGSTVLAFLVGATGGQVFTSALRIERADAVDISAQALDTLVDVAGRAGYKPIGVSLTNDGEDVFRFVRAMVYDQARVSSQQVCGGKVGAFMGIGSNWQALPEGNGRYVVLDTDGRDDCSDAARSGTLTLVTGEITDAELLQLIGAVRAKIRADSRTAIASIAIEEGTSTPVDRVSQKPTGPSLTIKWAVVTMPSSPRARRVDATFTDGKWNVISVTDVAADEEADQ
jgi:hypothetical protein